jgi:hypothetical protein
LSQKKYAQMLFYLKGIPRHCNAVVNGVRWTQCVVSFTQLAMGVDGETLWSLDGAKARRIQSQAVVSFAQLAGGIQKDRCIWIAERGGWQVLFDGLLESLEWVVAREIAKLHVAKSRMKRDKINAIAYKGSFMSIQDLSISVPAAKTRYGGR